MGARPRRGSRSSEWSWHLWSRILWMRSLVQTMLLDFEPFEKEPADRLPMRKGGAGNIRKHAWPWLQLFHLHI